METLFVGNNIIHLTEVDSTNSYAKALLKDVKLPEGTVISTDNQTKGKGQRGNIWVAEPAANITCSVILYPKFLNASDHFFLSKVISLAIHATLAELLDSGNYDIKIKWPNDILVNNKKICGTLIENSFRQDKLQESVIGIGLNVNQEDFGELSEKATSLKLLSDKGFDKATVLKRLLKHIEVQYLQLKQGKETVIHENYLKHLLLFGENSKFKDLKNDQELKGKIVDVLSNGHLVIETAKKVRKEFDMKEIGFGY